MFAKLWAASGVDYPTLLDRLIAPRARSPRGKAAIAHQPDMRRRAVVRAATLAATAVFLLPAAFGLLPSAALEASGRGDLTASDALLRVYDHILDARFATAASEMTRACARRRADARRQPAPPPPRRRKPATCSRPRRRGGGSCSIRKAAPSMRSSHAKSSTPSSGPKRGPNESRRAPRRISMPARPTPPACSGACCARRSWRRRATASASSRRSSGRSRSIPSSTTPTSGSGSTSTTRTSRRRPPRCCDSCCSFPGETRRRGSRR